jgi:hypothetical protein
MVVRFRTRRAGVAALAALVATIAMGTEGAHAGQRTESSDGHARPRALAFGAGSLDAGLLYVALSTADALAVVEPRADGPRLVARVPVCRSPAALAALPTGGVLVACRFEPAMRKVARAADGSFRVTSVRAGAESGARGLALSPDGALAYVASPATAGVKVVSLAGAGVVQTLATGLSPRALRVIPGNTIPGEPRALLLVSSFIDRRVTVHPIDDNAGRLGAAVQTIATEAPVLDLEVAPASKARGAALWLATHEDRPLSRPTGAVEGLDSGFLVLRARTGAAGPPFVDPGAGRRAFVNLSERLPTPVVELAALALDARSGQLAVVGGGTDNLLVAPPDATPLLATPAVTVGASPAAVLALPGGQGWVTADRLSDTLTFVDATTSPPRVRATLDVGVPERPSRAERGELLFFSRALTPHNVATGPLSLYTCAACHDDGHVDGRRHPSKRNRFFSMTKTCRGLGTTPPYLSLGEPETIEAFADNIVATHAQGADRAPDDYDRYPVTLRVRTGGHGDVPAWSEVTLSPDEVRAALAAYMVRIPTEPSPFVAPGRHALAVDERHGLEVFRDRCARCHQLVADTATGAVVPARALERRLLAGQVALTSARLYDVGTPVLGKTGNNPPSLRGVWDAAPYFSDGSARTLEDVLARTDPAAGAVHAPANATRPSAFSLADRAALLAFLRAL